MEKIKFANGNIHELAVNGIVSTDEVLRISLIADGVDLLVFEELVSDPDNVSRIELLSNDGSEVLGIYTGYVDYTTIIKKKSVHQYSETVADDNGDLHENMILKDVVTVTLRKPDEVEERLTSLEESVDFLTIATLNA